MVKRATPRREAESDAAEAIPMAIIDAPEFFVTNTQVVHAKNDFSILFSRIRLAGKLEDGSGRGPAQIGVVFPTVILNMSAATAKDLAVVVADVIEKYEAEFGVIETEFTRIRKAAQKK